MSITVDMVYENGAFRPVQPLALELAEGESVAITVVKAAAKAPLTDEEAARRIKSARSVQE
jgi:predicted DNA-binding antitoxin AbrB/MazE fold protein